MATQIQSFDDHARLVPTYHLVAFPIPADLSRKVLDGSVMDQTDINKAIRDWQGDFLRA